MKSIQKHMAISCLSIALYAVVLPINAQTVSIKLLPGLWEDEHVIMINGQNMLDSMHKQMEKNMAHMSPEQRAIMQESLDHSSGKRQYCLTPSEVAKGLDVGAIKKKMEETEKNCTFNIASASEKGGKFTAVCIMPDGTSSNSTGEYIVKNNKEWTYSMVSDGTIAGGQGGATNKIHAKIEAHAHWKDSKCGKVSAGE
ncbi:DUF3617 domain-containing protein [Undibacterium sp. RuRC25W]|uniref:DUF3617 domain-containing protein n=1 Tax=Undibacterium sp. RuRC25W TaxID=3413047 RepID=UPI003BF4117F